MENLDKNSPSANTCNNKNYENWYQGINNQFKDTFFFSFIIQFILVSLMYTHVGKGKYWRVLFYASFTGLLGAFIEHSTLAYICQKSQHGNHTRVPSFFVEEFFWIIWEYSIPYLNLIKMGALSNGTVVKFIKYFIYFLFFPFAGIRLYNGYDRMIEGYLYTPISKTCHGVAFGIMAIADCICTIFIIFFIKKKNRMGTLNDNGISNYIKSSSYTILISVDIVSFALSVLYIISTLFSDNSNLESSTTIFHCLKSVFILILATDAFIFKYGVNGGSTLKSSNNHSNHLNSNSNDYYKSKNSNSQRKYSVDVTSANYQSNKNNSSSPMEKEYYVIPIPVVENGSFPNSKPIIKNYSNISPSFFGEGKNYQSQKFGFSYKSKEYYKDSLFNNINMKN